MIAKLLTLCAADALARRDAGNHIMAKACAEQAIKYNLRTTSAATALQEGIKSGVRAYRQRVYYDNASRDYYVT
jgi:hypothetical protein